MNFLEVSANSNAKNEARPLKCQLCDAVFETSLVFV